jgi:hypothetical protein
MNMSTLDAMAYLRIWFWRSLAHGTEWAVGHRETVYHALRIAPFVTAALLAFMLGRLVGALLGMAA